MVYLDTPDDCPPKLTPLRYGCGEVVAFGCGSAKCGLGTHFWTLDRRRAGIGWQLRARGIVDTTLTSCLPIGMHEQV